MSDDATNCITMTTRLLDCDTSCLDEFHTKADRWKHNVSEVVVENNISIWCFSYRYSGIYLMSNVPNVVENNVSYPASVPKSRPFPLVVFCCFHGQHIVSICPHVLHLSYNCSCFFTQQVSFILSEIDNVVDGWSIYSDKIVSSVKGDNRKLITSQVNQYHKAVHSAFNI